MKKKEYLVDRDGGWGKRDSLESKKINTSLLSVINDSKKKENDMIQKENNKHLYPSFHEQDCKCKGCEWNDTYKTMICKCENCIKFMHVYVNNLQTIKYEGYGEYDEDKETEE